MQKINIGVLGCANIAERSIIPAIKNLPEYFNLIAVSSRDLKKASQFAVKFKCLAYGSYEELIDNDNIDAIYIPLPTGLHEKWVNLAIAKGKHVYAEKSIASNFNQASQMVKNAQFYQRALIEGFMFQYHKQHQHLKELISNGIIGEIRHFTASFGFPPLEPKNFRYNAELGGGALFDAAGYPVRAAFFILGDEIQISGASLYRNSNNTSIFGSAYFSGYNGVGAAISFGFDNYYQCYYQLWGSKGSIKVEKAYTPLPNYVPSFILETNGRVEIIKSYADNHFEKALIEFYNLISNDKLRDKHYKEILLQSKALNDIETYSK